MAKLKLDKESLQGFFFNHTEKIVLAIVLGLLGLFIWTGSSLEGIGAQNPAELASNVERVAKRIEEPSWDNIKQQYDLSLDHIERKKVGDAATPESYYRLDKPFTGQVPNRSTPRQDPELFAAIDLEATVMTGALAFKARPDWVDPFADLENMEQKKIEPPKKKKKKKKKTGMGMYGEGMEGMYMGEGMEESDDAAMYGEGMEGMYGGMMGPMGGEMGGAAATSAVRADGDKFHGYRPTATSTATGSSVIGRSVHVVAVKALVPYQQQWDEFERVFTDAAGYMPSRDIPRYIAFKAERAEVPNDPDQPLAWKLLTTTAHSLMMIPKYGFAGYPGELADAKYISPGILTMPVPPVMMRDLRPLALHSKVPLQEEVKAQTVDRTGPELVDINELGATPDADAIATAPGVARPGTGAMGAGMYGAGGEGMYGAGAQGMYGMGGEGMYGMGGEGMYGGGMGAMGSQLVRGPQAEFLMVRFFDYISPGKKYVYRIQVILEDPNHPQNPQMQPQDRILADTVRTRLAAVAADEAKQTAAKKTPIRLSMLTSEWSEPTAPVFVDPPSDTYAGEVTQPRLLDLVRAAAPNAGEKSGFAIAIDGEPAAEVMNLSWNAKYAIDVPGIVKAAPGAYLAKKIEANVIDPITLIYKKIPDYPLASGELVVDLRGGEVLEAKGGDTPPLLTPGEIAVVDSEGNFIVRNELDDWQVFDKYAPPPPAVVEAAPAAGDMYGEGMMMGAGEPEGMYGE